MNYSTKKDLKGQRFKALMINKGTSIEDIPAIREALKNQIKGCPSAIMTETETTFEFNNGQFILKPKRHREQLGILDCTKSYAEFNGCRIEYSDMKVEDKAIGYACFETEFSEIAIHALIN